MNDRTEENDPRIERAIEELPAEIEPARDLWPGIEARVREAGTPGGRGRAPARPRGLSPDTWRWLAIAAVLVIAVTSVMLGITDRLGPTLAGLNLPQPIELGGSGNDGWDAAGASSGGEVMAALDSRADELDPATVRTIRENLAVIDDALAEIEAALEQDPANTRLASLKTSGEKRRSEVLKKAALLAGST